MKIYRNNLLPKKCHLFFLLCCVHTPPTSCQSGGAWYGQQDSILHEVLVLDSATIWRRCKNLGHISEGLSPSFTLLSRNVARRTQACSQRLAPQQYELSFFCCALKRRRRDNIALITALPVLDFCVRRATVVWGKSLLSRKTHNKRTCFLDST